ncbi:MAG: nucleotidyltransferase family protein [Chloroflexi bacterium]|nr:nucleotidyltransferase family protein [Chloroflexota bacterium]
MRPVEDALLLCVRAERSPAEQERLRSLLASLELEPHPPAAGAHGAAVDAGAVAPGAAASVAGAGRTASLVSVSPHAEMERGGEGRDPAPVPAWSTDQATDQAERLPHDQRLTWQRLWREAAHQQVLPLVARTLAGAAVAAALPPAVVQYAKGLRLRTMLHNMAVHAELGRIGARLHVHGIPAAPLKGSHLAERLYHALDARQVGDIDLLVPESDVEAARAVLLELGYAPFASVSHGIEEHTFHGVPFLRQDPSASFVVELHWGLSNPRFVTIDYARLWQRVLAGSSDRAPLRPLPGEETLLFLSLHLAKHETGVLRLLADIDRLLRREGPALDWPYVLALARRWQVTGLVYFALHHAQRLYATPVPEWALQELRPATWRRALVGVLAGPQAILHAAVPERLEYLRYHRFRLAYCAMLTPFRRFLDAYQFYLFPPLAHRQPGLFRRAIGSAERVGRGIAWTGLAFANSLAESWRAGAEA